MEMNKFYCCKGNDYQSRNLIGPYQFWGISPQKFDFIHWTVFSPGGAQDYVYESRLVPLASQQWLGRLSLAAAWNEFHTTNNQATEA